MNMQNAHLETVMFTLIYVYYDISDVARAFEILSVPLLTCMKKQIKVSGTYEQPARSSEDW